MNRQFNMKALVTLALFFNVSIVSGQSFPQEKVKTDFISLLERPHVDLQPHFESTTTDSVIIERGFFYAEANEKVPTLIYKPISSGLAKLPVVICLHGTGGTKDSEVIKNLLMRFVKEGFIGIAIDARYHGERNKSIPRHNFYNEAIIKAWREKNIEKQEHPFFFDTVYDLWRLMDYLSSRSDVDMSRIGMTGISMGGIETWMAASVDTRVKVVVPVIAVQSFKWSLENNRWQGRAGTIRSAHEQVAKDLGDTAVNSKNVKALWDKILPGILNEFDCPSMIRLLAPRPLLVLNTEKDQNCPLPGAEIAFDAARKAYQSENASEKLAIDVEPNKPHRFTLRQTEMMIEWFRKWL